MLPKIDTQVYELTLPLSDKHITFRPFLVREQKNLMIAMESDDKDEIERNIKQVLKNCTVSEVDIDSLPLVDVEYYFINLRARSVGEIVESKYKCLNVIGEGEEGKPCNNMMDINMNLLEIKLDKPAANEEIKLNEKLSVKMKYPIFSLLDHAKAFNNNTEMAFDMIIRCIDYVFDGQQKFYANEVSRENLVEFIESMNHTQFAKIEEFFDHIPKLNKTIKPVCGKCGFNHTIEVEGLDNFFGS